MEKNKPQLISALICDQLISANNGKNTLVGLFSEITSTDFPALHRQMVFYCAWVNNDFVGKKRIHVNLLGKGKADRLLNFDAELEFQIDKKLTYAIINIENVIFPKEGEYRLSLYLDEEKQAEVPLFLRKLPKSVET